MVRIISRSSIITTIQFISPRQILKASSLFLLLLALLTLQHGLAVEGKEPEGEKAKSTNPSPQCAKITCTTPPEDLKCNKTEIKNPSLLKKIGKMKDCCFAWRCKEEDGSFSTYFGMSGTETVKEKSPEKVDKKADGKNTSADEKTNASANASLPMTTEPPKAAVAKPTPSPPAAAAAPPVPAADAEATAHAPTPKDDKGEADKCMEAKATCPLPDEGGEKCIVTKSKDAMQFKPKGDLDSCCPIYNCTTNGVYHKLHYLMKGGDPPTKAVDIAKEKGSPSTPEKKCPNVQCAMEPPGNGADGPICEKSSEESSRIKALGSFRECCEIWKCVYTDRSYYTHFELQAPSFWLAETSFQSEVPEEMIPTTLKPEEVSGDEVGQADGQQQQQQPPSTSNSYSSSYSSSSSWSAGGGSGSMGMPPPSFDNGEMPGMSGMGMSMPGMMLPQPPPLPQMPMQGMMMQQQMMMPSMYGTGMFRK